MWRFPVIVDCVFIVTPHCFVSLDALVQFVVFACGKPENAPSVVGFDTWVASLQRADDFVKVVDRRHGSRDLVERKRMGKDESSRINNFYEQSRSEH